VKGLALNPDAAQFPGTSCYNCGIKTIPFPGALQANEKFIRFETVFYRRRAGKRDIYPIRDSFFPGAAQALIVTFSISTTAILTIGNFHD
jgi:hypothetical protein